MPELIDKKETISLIRDRFCDECYTKGECDGCEYKYCLEAVEDVPAISDIDRAAILRLCNEIEDAVTSIDKMNPSQNTWYELCFIRDKLKEIGKELTGDDGTD